MRAIKAMAISLMLFSCTTSPETSLPTPEHPQISAPISEAPTTAAAPIAGEAAIKIGHSGKCLDVPGGSRLDRARLQQWTCNGTNAQKFRVQDNDNDGWFALINVQSGKCLDAQGGSAALGTPIIQYTCSNGGWNQQFRLGPNNAFIARHSGTCLDVKDWSQADGGQIQLWTCGIQGNQNFAWQGGGAPPPANDGWKLVWSDEFNGQGDVDRSKWNYEVWRPYFVNNERQAYTDNRRENVRQEGGNLVIEGRRDWYNGNEYTSGRIKTQGKVSWLYGRMEARMKVPGGNGPWSAFWMMPDDQSRGWPSCGEIDIVENVGWDHAMFHGTIHNNKLNHVMKTQVMGSANADPNQFHVFAIEWYPTHIAWFLDGREYHRFNNPNRGDDYWGFDKRYHLILNLAIGGDWGSVRGLDPNIWPRQMLVDYIRVWQR